ncbi:MAG: hypothetical protein F6K50_16080 [Moorea sp. SIO3I7]|nr:hypothetical protein [Moorena sp. SIO3I8]NEN96993.1 hypothetical protein [Moorena sp. SIO3I7]NEO06806.1 hypothetical protein [Moorena sp. SIO3I8]
MRYTGFFLFSLLPLAYCLLLLPCSLLPAPCSLKPRTKVPHRNYKPL